MWQSDTTMDENRTQIYLIDLICLIQSSDQANQVYLRHQRSIFRADSKNCLVS